MIITITNHNNNIYLNYASNIIYHINLCLYNLSTIFYILIKKRAEILMVKNVNNTSMGREKHPDMLSEIQYQKTNRISLNKQRMNRIELIIE